MSDNRAGRRTYRVAMVAAKPFPVPQGSQVLVRQTAQIMQARGHEVHLVVYGHGVGETPPDLRVHRAANPPGARKTLAGPSWAKPLQDAALVRTLRTVVREQRIDIVHAHNYEGLLVALAVGARPIVYHAHTCMRDELPYFVRPKAFAAVAGQWLDASLPRRADGVIALHNRARDYLVAHGCRISDIAVIPPPCDPELVLPENVREDLPVVLYMGNLDAYQNLALVAQAMVRVRADFPEAHFEIATADSRPFPAASARVEVRDVFDLRRVLSRDTVVACPRASWCGYPIKLLNAMAAGKGIVACAGAAHGLRHRETALVTPDDDADSFAAALLELMRDPILRARLGAAAQHDALTLHDPQQIGVQIEKMYDSVAMGPGRES